MKERIVNIALLEEGLILKRFYIFFSFDFFGVFGLVLVNQLLLCKVGLVIEGELTGHLWN